MTVKLICTDVDGTLVGSTGTPTDEVWAAADRARARGQHLSMCTARAALGESWRWATRLDPEGWHAFHNGAAIRSAADESVYEVPLPTPVRQVIAERCGGYCVEWYSATEVACDSDDPLASEHAKLLGIEHRRRSVETLPGDVVRAQVIVPIERTPDVYEALSETALEAATATSPLMPGVALISVTAAGVTKGFAVRRLAELAGVSLADTMMVGDGENDLEALLIVGLGVVMGNASELVRAAADVIVAGVDEDGAARAFDLAADSTR